MCFGWARLPKPPLSGFVGHSGECRDKEGGYGTRIECNGAITLDDCESMCVKQVTQRPHLLLALSCWTERGFEARFADARFN